MVWNTGDAFAMMTLESRKSMSSDERKMISASSSSNGGRGEVFTGRSFGRGVMDTGGNNRRGWDSGERTGEKVGHAVV